MNNPWMLALSKPRKRSRRKPCLSLALAKSGSAHTIRFSHRFLVCLSRVEASHPLEVNLVEAALHLSATARSVHARRADGMNR
jgi:hypothetical protein